MEEHFCWFLRLGKIVDPMISVNLDIEKKFLYYYTIIECFRDCAFRIKSLRQSAGNSLQSSGSSVAIAILLLVLNAAAMPGDEDDDQMSPSLLLKVSVLEVLSVSVVVAVSQFTKSLVASRSSFSRSGRLR